MTVANKNEIKGFKQGKKEIKEIKNQYDTYFLKKKKKKKNSIRQTYAPLMRENVPSAMCTQRRFRSACISKQLIWQSLMSAWRNFASLAIHNMPTEDSDQTA